MDTKSTESAGDAPLVGRRTTLRAAGAGFGLWFLTSTNGRSMAVEAPAPSALGMASPSSLDPSSIQKYQTPMLILRRCLRGGGTRSNRKMGKNVDYYEIASASSRRRSCRPLSRPRPSGATAPSAPRDLRQSSTAVVDHRGQVDRPVRVKWINELVDGTGNYLPHLLPLTRRSTGPTRPREGRPGHAAHIHSTPGPVHRAGAPVTHVHGAVGVGDESDGYTEAWNLPAANDIPANYATEGTWYDFFAGKDAVGIRRDLGAGLRHLPVSEPRPGDDRLVPRPCPGIDPPQRLRGARRLLHPPGWPE